MVEFDNPLMVAVSAPADNVDQHLVSPAWQVKYQLLHLRAPFDLEMREAHSCALKRTHRSLT